MDHNHEKVEKSQKSGITHKCGITNVMVKICYKCVFQKYGLTINHTRMQFIKRHFFVDISPHCFHKISIKSS